MLRNSKLQTDANNREKLPMDRHEIPYITFHNDDQLYENGGVPWHWHTAMEIDCVESGSMTYRTPEARIDLNAGDILFINSSVVHSCDFERGSHTVFYALLFDTSFLCSNYGDIIDRKYIHPIQQCSSLQTYMIKNTSLNSLEMAGSIWRLIELAKNESFGHELLSRAELSRFWCLFLEETKEIRAKSSQRSHVDSDRLKSMISYIQDNYAEKVSLEDIAGAAGISTRECVRCFTRCIDQTPVNFLNDYRLNMAMQFLVSTGDSVTEISENCGFSSLSYFGKAFRDKTGCTPNEYRKGNRKT